MKHTRILCVLGGIVAVLMLLACDAGTFIALVSPGTPTPTRTVRPTFTPRPAFTPTPENSPTPEATATAAASPTPTKRAVVPTTRPAATKPPAPPPAPQFAWKQSSSPNQGRCDAGPGTFEVKGRIRLNDKYAGGIHVVLLDKDGKMIAQMDSLKEEQMNLEWGVNCFEEKNLFNYQLDASAGRNNQPMTLRLTRGSNDLTPISTDVKLNFPSGGSRFYIDWASP